MRAIMNLKLFIFKNVKYIFTLAVVAASVLFRDKFESLYNSFLKVAKNPEIIEGMFTQEELATFNGIANEKLYLAVIGSIFDVTEGSRHYAKDAPYNYFIGKDGSRALITGNFKDESKDKDHVLDMSCKDLMSILDWQNTFKDKYIPVGMLVGRYFNTNGKETVYMKELKNKLEHCKLEKEMEKKDEIKFPPCNISWDVDQGTKVWCTKTSGGVSRSWVGVPHQLFTPGNEKPRCACINLDADNAGALLKKYKNCPETSSSCILGNDS